MISLSPKERRRLAKNATDLALRTANGEQGAAAQSREIMRCLAEDRRLTCV